MALPRRLSSPSLSECRRGDFAGEAEAKDERDFVHGGDVENDSAGAVRVREHGRVGDEWLRAQNALRFRPPNLGAPVPQLKREVAPNHGFLRRHVLLGGESSPAAATCCCR